MKKKEKKKQKTLSLSSICSNNRKIKVVFWSHTRNKLEGVYLLFSAMAACLWLRETNKHANKEGFCFSVTAK